MPSPGPLLKLANVTKRYESPEKEGSLAVLRDISLEVSGGESLAIVGPSGSGKSTLLHIIGTLDRATSGQVSIGGRDISQLNEEELAALRNLQIGLFFKPTTSCLNARSWKTCSYRR